MVIQRWQSVLLLCVAIVMGCFSFFTIGQVQTPEYSLNFTAMGFDIEGMSPNSADMGCYLSTWWLFSISLLSMILPLINIFLFNNLKLQKKVCLVELLVLVAIAVSGGVIAYTAIPEATSVSWTSLVCCPFIGMFADIMAYRRIEADRKLLLDSNRLR